MSSNNFFEAAKLAFRKNMTKSFTQALMQIFNKMEFKSDIIYHDFEEGVDFDNDNKFIVEEENNDGN